MLADAIARYEKLIGRETFFVWAEHGQNYNKAVSKGKTAQELVDMLVRHLKV